MSKPTFWNGKEKLPTEQVLAELNAQTSKLKYDPKLDENLDKIHQQFYFAFDDKRQVYYNTNLQIIITKQAQEIIDSKFILTDDNQTPRFRKKLVRKQYKGWKFTSKKHLTNSVKRSLLVAYDVKKQQRIKNTGDKNV